MTGNMRKSFDGLSGIIIGKLGDNPMSGDIFIFINEHIFIFLINCK